MAEPLRITLATLERTRNQAAVPVLVAALDSRRADIRSGAIRALVKRRSAEGHTAILRRFNSFGLPERETLEESLPSAMNNLTAAVHDAIVDQQQDLCESACHLILFGAAYDHLPTLVTIAEDRKHRHSYQAAATLIQLTRMLHDELGGKRRQHARDPFFVRRQVLSSLENSVTRYGEHQRLEIVDAFLLLVPPANPTLEKVLSDPSQPCHEPVTATLRSSAVIAIMELLTKLMHDTKTPQSALEIVASRTDRKFLAHFLQNIGSPVSLRVQENMKRLKAVSWLQEHRDALAGLDGPAQATAVELAVASGVGRQEVFDVLTFLQQSGTTDGRRASCAALSRFRDPRAEQYVLEALQDEEPTVRAAAAGQLRSQGVLDAMVRLVAMLDDPADEVRDAARTSLAEFNFDRYESLYDSMDGHTRQSAGQLVGKVDRSAQGRLAGMLRSPSPTLKMRGLEMIVTMRLADEVRAQLIELLDDIDLAVRAEAAAALGTCRNPDVLPALRRAEGDADRAVREAAEHSIDLIAENCVVAANLPFG